MYREFAYRSELHGWTPSRIIAARDMADNGVLQEAADCVEALMTDDRVDGVLSTRTHGLMGLPLHFSGGLPEARDVLAGGPSAPGEWWSMHDEAELTRLLSWGIVLGVGLAQRIPLDRQPGQIQRYRIETWSPRWLRYDYELDTWFVQTKEGVIEIDDSRWILFLPYGSHRPWSNGKWTSLAFPWILKRFSLEDRANHSQVMGSPAVVAKAPAGATANKRNEMSVQIQSLSKDSRFTLPSGWDLEIVEATGRTWEIYSEQIDWCDKSITISIAGQIVTTEGTPGFSSGNIHDQIKNDLIRFDAERLSTCLARQSLVPWCLINFGSDKAPWPTWKTDRPADLEQQTRTFEAAGRAFATLDQWLARDDLQLDARELVGRFNLPVEPRPEDAPVPAPAAQPIEESII